MTGKPRYTSKIFFKISRAFSRVNRSEHGTVAVIFALAILPVVGMTSLGIEYSRASSMRAAMQQYADASALNAAVWRKDNKEAEATGDRNAFAGYDPMAGMNEAVKQFKDRYTGQISSFSAKANWIGDDQFEITMSATMPPMTLSMIGDIHLDTVTVAKVFPQLKEPEKPQVVFLDSDASDYNRLYVYCYEQPDWKKPSSQWKPVAERRRAFTAISDNAGSQYNYTMPICEKNETLSLMLHNVASARTKPSSWEGNPPNRYYSDTNYGKNDYNKNSDPQEYNFNGYSMVETVVCNTLAECKPKTQGGIVPTGAGRTPAKNTTPCKTGNFIYHGFEDRPVGGDRDYNDIRIVLECPKDPEYIQRVVLAR